MAAIGGARKPELGAPLFYGVDRSRDPLKSTFEGGGQFDPVFDLNIQPLQNRRGISWYNSAFVVTYGSASPVYKFYVVNQAEWEKGSGQFFNVLLKK